MDDFEFNNALASAAQRQATQREIAALREDLARREAEEKAAPKCPYCAGPITKGVLKCRHCASDIQWSVVRGVSYPLVAGADTATFARAQEQRFQLEDQARELAAAEERKRIQAHALEIAEKKRRNRPRTIFFWVMLPVTVGISGFLLSGMPQGSAEIPQRDWWILFVSGIPGGLLMHLVFVGAWLLVSFLLKSLAGRCLLFGLVVVIGLTVWLSINRSKEAAKFSAAEAELEELVTKGLLLKCPHCVDGYGVFAPSASWGVCNAYDLPEGYGIPVEFGVPNRTLILSPGGCGSFFPLPTVDATLQK